MWIGRTSRTLFIAGVVAVVSGLLTALTPASSAGAATYAEQVLYRFCSQTNCVDGKNPAAALIMDAGGNLYGTTSAGGNQNSACSANGCGTVFELSPLAGGKWKETILYSFTGGSDGKNPYGGVILDSKGDLYAEAITQILNEKQLLSSDGVSIDPRAFDSAAQFVRDYLSREHFEDIDGTCPLIAFPTDFLREEHRVRQAFETVLRVMIDIFEQAMQRNGQAARSRARAIATLCVGGMVLARSIEDRVLADEIREAAMGIALSLGQWPHRTSCRN